MEPKLSDSHTPVANVNFDLRNPGIHISFVDILSSLVDFEGFELKLIHTYTEESTNEYMRVFAFCYLQTHSFSETQETDHTLCHRFLV